MNTRCDLLSKYKLPVPISGGLIQMVDRYLGSYSKSMSSSHAMPPVYPIDMRVYNSTQQIHFSGEDISFYFW